ncbi:MAG: hypothetical protein WCR20_01720 [Verrucomicrobiota bacterium]|jgi:hypothetical protein|nr:hypothetical protein [Verrucomicrobiota bacterium]
MTTINHNANTANLKQEVRQIQEAARKVLRSKESAIRFLHSTGMHSATGKLKPRFR